MHLDTFLPIFGAMGQKIYEIMSDSVINPFFYTAFTQIYPFNNI